MKHGSIREKILRVYQENQSKGFNISNLARIIHCEEDAVSYHLNKLIERGILYTNEGLRYLHPSYKAQYDLSR